ncbi:hypothetical protein D3C80_1270470 [compost metagenome]
MLQLSFIINLVGIAGPGAEVGLDHQRESGAPDEIIHAFPGGSGRELDGAYPAFAEKFLHSGLLLQVLDEIIFGAVDVKISPDRGILLQPVFIQRLKPVDFTVFVGEIADGPQNFFVILEVRYLIVFR